ncbi:MAG TPA: DUF4157 domain-containing protein [Allosphingosinicella sp.]|nr:DUF4157 domain-containing protein [Allosphingosinicella sp.]
MGAASASVAKGPASAGYAPPAALLAERAGGDGYMPPLASLSAIPARPAVQRADAGEGREELTVQPRLEVGPVGDRFEQEADAIAAQVMATREAGTAEAAPAASVQRACGACSASVDEPRARRTSLIGEEIGEAAPAVMRTSLIGDEISEAPPMIQRECAACAASEDSRSARRTSLIGAEIGQASPDDAWAARGRRTAGAETIAASDSQLTSGGSPLSESTRTFFESRMGRDLGGVRVHQGDGARALNRSIAARAFTYRDHIWLGAGESAGPSFTMAHELAHVMQQTAPGPLGRPAPRVRRVACNAKENLFFFPKKGGSINDFHDETSRWVTKKDTSIIGEVRVPNYGKKGFTTVPERFGFADLVRTNNGNLVGMGFTDAKPKMNSAGTATTPGATPAATPGTTPGATPASTPGTTSGATPGGGGAGPAISAAQYWYMAESLQAGGWVKPVNLSTHISMYAGSRGVTRNGKTFDPIATEKQMDAKAAPRWQDVDFMRDAATAPTDIKVGEIKFGGGRDLSMEARQQAVNYVNGFKSAAKGYEKLRDRNLKAHAGANDILDKSSNASLAPWTLGADLMSTWGGPTGWEPVSGSQDLVIAKWERTPFNEYLISPCANTKQEFQGKLFAQHDSANTFLWLYAFQAADSSGKFGANAKAAFKPHQEVAHSLQGDLFASPTDKDKAVMRPLEGAPAPAPDAALQPPVRALSAASRDGRGVARPKPAKPIPAEDFFARNYEAWKAKQLKLTEDFGGFEKSAAGKSATGDLLFDTAVRNTVDITGKDPSGRTTQQPSAGDQRKDRDTLNEIQLMSGVSGRVLGMLRKTFGTAFVKVINVYRGLKQKFDDFMKGRKAPASKGGRLAAGVIKVAGQIFAAVLRHLLPQIGHLLISCVERGFKAAIEKWIGADIQAVIGDKVEEFQSKLEKVERDIHARVDEAVGGISTWLHGKYESILETWDEFGELLAIARTAFNAARVAMCAAGGLETVGIACVVAGADFVLSLFDVSPGELLAGALLGTCVAQKMIAENILQIDTIRKLPATIAQKILEFVRPLLPTEPVNIAGMLCDSIAGETEMPEVKEVTCGEGGSGSSTPTGPGWGVPPGIDPKMLNRPPLEDEIKKHGTLDHMVEKDKPPPPPAPPKPSGAEPGSGAEGKEKEGADSVGEGNLGPDAKISGITLEVHAGFNPDKAYDGKTYYTVQLVAVASDASIYGPVSVDIYVHKAFRSGAGARVTYTFRVKKTGANIVLTDSKTGKQLEIYGSATKKFTSVVRPPKAPKTASLPEEKK